MSDTRFRQLLILYAACLVAGLVIAFVPGGYSQELADAYANEPEPWLVRNFWLFMSIVLLLLIASIAGLIGLFLFKSWGRTLSLSTTIVGFAIFPFVGPELSSALEGALIDASTFLWGAALALAYYAPISSRFSANKSSKPTPLRGSV